MSLPEQSRPTAEQLVARLQAQARHLETELQALLALPIDEQTPADELAGKLEAALKAFWNASQPHSVPRFKALIALFRQQLYDEVALKVHDGSLVAAHQFYLPAPGGGGAETSLDIHALYLGAEEQRSVEVHGALVFGRENGPCLLYLPGKGIESFVSHQALRENLAAWLNNPALSSLLLRNTSLEYQHNSAQLDMDPDLSAAPASAADIMLLPLGTDPFEQAIKSQISKQRNDVAWVCSQQALREHDRPRWRLDMQTALDMRAQLGPASMLTLRASERQQRELRLKAPQWLHAASAEQRNNWLDSLSAYEQSRLILQTLMQGCASAQQFADTRLAQRLQNDLGYDLNPQHVMVTTQRSSPLGSQHYVQNQSLSLLALNGLHPDDLNSDSAFQTQTRFSLDGVSLETAYPLLTAQWVANTLADLDLRVGFGEAQRNMLGNTQVKEMMGRVLHRQILTQAWAALYQGHLQPGDTRLIHNLQDSADAVPVRVQQLSWGQHLLAGLLVFRLPQENQEGERLVLFARDVPREQQLQGFDNQRQLLHELVSWSRSAQLSDYLLSQVPAAQRPVLEQQLQQLKDKAQPAADLLGFKDYSPADALYAMTTAHIRLKLDEQQQHTPDWLLAASPEQRRELQSLDDAVAAISADYQQQPHTRTPDYERFVHQMASRKLNALLQQPDGTVDPDQVIITSPRETLSYTRMLRDGYDDSLGFLNGTAADQATFSGPAGLDLSKLSAETVAASVRGAWPSDAWIAHVKSTLLDPQSEGYDYRRSVSLLLLQLQMRSAALRSLLTHRISEPTYTWLKASIDHMHHGDTHSRERHPVHPLRFRIDNPFIASIPELGDILSTVGKYTTLGVPVSRMETALGCYILCPQDDLEQAVLYTPDAPDGLAFRPLSLFMETLHNPGMSDYYRNRCHRIMDRILAFYFIDLKKRKEGPPPVLPDKPYDDLHEVCYERALQRQLRDIEDTTEGRSDMIAKVVISSLETLAMAITLPFPPASFAVGIALAVRDSVKALAALGEGDQSAASLHVLSTWLNLFGAGGDAAAGLKGFGGLLRHLAERGGHNRAMAAARQAQGNPAGLLKYLDWHGQPSAMGKPLVKGHPPLFRAPPHDPQKLLASGHFTQEEIATVLRPLAPESALPTPPMSSHPTPAHAVSRSLSNTTPIDTGHAKGVIYSEGHYYIKLDTQVFEVQYDATQRLWQIIDPANPFAFFGKQPVRLTDSGQWTTVDAFRLRGGGGAKFNRLQSQPGTSSAATTTQSVNAAYQLPEKWRHHVMGIADHRWMPIEDFGLELPPEYFGAYFKEPRQLYKGLRDTLREDALKFFDQAPLAAKPQLPALDENLTADTLIKAVFERHQGMVVSEAPRCVASKRFLIDNMPRLAEQNVEIIYIEHLFTDMHLQKLQKYLLRAGKKPSGSSELKAHLETLNQGILNNHSRSRHDYYHVIKAAHRHGIEIRPFNSSVSYDFLRSTAPVHDPVVMQKMSVFFGSRLISADTAQAPARRWVALLEQRHANMHQQTPGIAELHGAFSLRAQDVARHQPVRIVRDLPSTDPHASLNHADLRLELPPPDIRTAQPEIRPSASGAVESERLDHALQLMFGRSSSSHPDDLPLSRQLLADPGPHGFALNETGQWQRADAAGWPTNREPAALQRSMADAQHQMPEEHVDAIHELALFEKRGLNMFYSNDKPHLEAARELFFKQRARLLRDAQQLTSEPLPLRPVLPDIGTDVTHTGLLDELYSHTQGLVIGEYHSSIASKQLIIDNLPHLSKNQVKTLYLEHLQADLHQLDLDLFAETGLMSKRLLHYLKRLDQGFFTDPAGRYTFEQLVIKARQHGIEVRALDCAPSYYLSNMPNPSRTDRLIMMNYFASRTIRRHQQVTGAHKWLALVGETHASRFDKSVPGLAELEQGISLRVFDVAEGASFGPAGDPGRVASDQLGRHTSLVRNDYALGLPTRHGPSTRVGEMTPAGIAAPPSLEARLYLPGRFTVEGADSASPVIIHRSRANRIERTPVLKDAKGRLYLDRESWKTVHLRRFHDLPALLQALRGMNLTQVS